MLPQRRTCGLEVLQQFAHINVVNTQLLCKFRALSKRRDLTEDFQIIRGPRRCRWRRRFDVLGDAHSWSRGVSRQRIEEGEVLIVVLVNLLIRIEQVEPLRIR